MDAQQKKKTETIICLTVLAFFLMGLFVSLRWLPDTIADRNPVVALVFLLAVPGVLICDIGVLRAMRGWSVHWIVKLVLIVGLGSLLFTRPFVHWVMTVFFLL